MAEKPRLLMDPLPDDLYMALGKLAARYGQLEHVIGLAMKRHDTSRTWEEVFDQLHKLGREAGAAQALQSFGVTVIDQHKEGALLALFVQADALARDRHRVTHAGWEVTQSKHELKANHNGEPIPDTPETITKLAGNLYEVVIAIHKLTSADTVPPGQKPLTVEVSAKPFTMPPSASDFKPKQ